MGDYILLMKPRNIWRNYNNIPTGQTVNVKGFDWGDTWDDVTNFVWENKEEIAATSIAVFAVAFIVGSTLVGGPGGFFVSSAAVASIVALNEIDDGGSDEK